MIFDTRLEANQHAFAHGGPSADRRQFGAAVSEDAEPHRLALASDLRWLINEGYVIEFNDGSLDRPRMKSRPQEAVPAEAALSSSSSRLAVEERQLALATPRALTLYSPQP